MSVYMSSYSYSNYGGLGSGWGWGLGSSFASGFVRGLGWGFGGVPGYSYTSVSTSSGGGYSYSSYSAGYGLGFAASLIAGPFSWVYYPWWVPGFFYWYAPQQGSNQQAAGANQNAGSNWAQTHPYKEDTRTGDGNGNGGEQAAPAPGKPARKGGKGKTAGAGAAGGASTATDEEKFNKEKDAFANRVAGWNKPGKYSFTYDKSSQILKVTATDTTTKTEACDLANRKKGSEKSTTGKSFISAVDGC